MRKIKFLLVLIAVAFITSVGCTSDAETVKCDYDIVLTDNVVAASSDAVAIDNVEYFLFESNRTLLSSQDSETYKSFLDIDGWTYSMEYDFNHVLENKPINLKEKDRIKNLDSQRVFNRHILKIPLSSNSDTYTYDTGTPIALMNVIATTNNFDVLLH